MTNKKQTTLVGNIGYLDLHGFVDTRYAGETAVAAMNFLSNCSALIIEDIPYFRLQVVSENGKIKGLRGLYDNGHEDFSEKEGA